MQYSQDHLKTMVYAKFGRQTECIMGNWKIENTNFAEILNALEPTWNRVIHYKQQNVTSQSVAQLT